jgi:hypothetical protein
MASISVSSPPSHVNPAIPQQRSGLGDKCRWPGKVERKRLTIDYARLKMSQCRSPCKIRTPPRSCWPFCRPGPERRQQIPMATSQSGHRSPPHPRATHDKAHAGVNLCERRRSGHSRPTKETPHPLNIIQVLPGAPTIVEMAARSEDLSAITKFANRLETLLQRTDASFTQLIGDNRTGDLLADVADHNYVDALLHQVTAGLVDTAQNSSSGRTPAEMEMSLLELRAPAIA